MFTTWTTCAHSDKTLIQHKKDLGKTVGDSLGQYEKYEYMRTVYFKNSCG